MAIALRVAAVSTVRPERCCAHACDYAVPTVRYHLGRILAHERAGEETGRLYATSILGRFGTSPADGDTAAIDIRRVVDQLRAEGLAVTAESVAARLCPWSSET